MASVVELPIFPLSDVVLFPQLHVPLHIFEQRYRQMTEAALAGDRRIGMVAVLPAQISSMHGNPETFLIGCAGPIEEYRLLPDGRYNIVLLGTKRFRIKCERPPTATRLYRIAEVELLKEAHDLEDGAELAQKRAHVMDLFGELMSRLGRVDGSAPGTFDETENAVLINSIASASSFKAEERQRLLEENGVRARFEQLSILLRFALAELDAGRRPHSGFLH